MFAGRSTAFTPSSYVVFLIGMRVNRLFAFRKWMQVGGAMPRMLRELYANPELGFLGGETLLNWRGVTSLQYWRPFDHLHAYAHARDAAHEPAWAAFNRESIYGNMPPWGLSRAFGRLPISGVNDGARQRVEGK
jgi:hypothetical protein